MSREGWNKYTEIHFWADRSLEATICVRRAPEQPDFSPAELRCLGDLRNTVEKAVHRLRALHQERHTANALRELILRMPLPLVLLDWSLQPICFNFEARRACLEWTHGAEYARAMKSSMVPDLPLEIMRACAGQKRMMHGLPRKAARFHPRFDTVPHPARSDLSAQVEVVENEGTGQIWKNFLVRFQKTAGAPPVATAIAPTGREAPLALLSCLTPCEREIALAVRDGRTNAEIGLQLYKCEATVKMQVHSIFRKLDVSNRTQLATLLH
jgi:DNA-binding CsgD family transcriptional regulator